MRRFISSLRVVAIGLLAFVNVLIRLFSMQDYMMFSGLGLVSYGLSYVYLPAAFIVPGAVLSAVAITISFKGAK